MNPFAVEEDRIAWRMGDETFMVEPWGPDALRVRATRNATFTEEDWALVEPELAQVTTEVGEEKATVTNGLLAAEVSRHGLVRFYRASDGQTLLEEYRPIHRPNRHHASRGGGTYRVMQRFKARDDERIFGLGQHQHGRLDQKGLVVDLVQLNTEVAIPFLVSSLGYGFLWNNPSIGRVELGRESTRWVAEAAREIDYVVVAAGSYAGLMGRYADLTGHAPEFPEWASGFWQCKARYVTQEEFLGIAREYNRRGLPLSVIVVDFFHWSAQGDWKFDPECWPDPEAMVKEIASLGAKVMVSIWPTVEQASGNFGEMASRGLLAGTERGVGPQMGFIDKWGRGAYVHYYDPTNPAAREFIWSKVREGYHSIGIEVFWLDACEPEIQPADHENMRYHLGNGLEVGCIYPMLHQRGFYDGMRAAGQVAVLNLCRSAWAGSQRFGAAVWSGDIPSTWEALRDQVRAGLNIGMSGIPWWTTDIGGFFGGDIGSPEFHELLVRWFQYGAFCPLFRLHGFRSPGGGTVGAPNEVWSFGESVYAILKEYLFVRERLRPYVMRQMRLASANGTPPMRPVFFDFADDEECYGADDEFLFGPDILVAPVLEPGAASRSVYLPAGAEWTDAWTGERRQGGQRFDAAAPLERIPLFLKDGAELPIRG